MMLQMNLNWNIEVLFTFLGSIFFFVFTIIFLRLAILKKKKIFLSLFITFSVFTAFHLLETTAYIFLSFELKRISAMMYSIGLLSLILNVDLVSKERLNYFKSIIASFIIGCTIILALVPENIEFYNHKYFGYPTLGVAGPLQIINILSLFLLGFQLVYWFYKTWRKSPLELKKDAFNLFIVNLVFYCCILILFSLGLYLIFPIGYLIAAGSTSIVTIFICRKPKLLHVLSFNVHRITIITNHSGIPLFNLSWNIRKSSSKDEQHLLANWLPILQQLSQKISKSLIVEEIKLENNILLFKHGEFITAVLLSENSTPTLRESLDKFVKSFEKQYRTLLKTGMTDHSYYEEATDLINEFFPIGTLSTITSDNSLDSYLEDLVKQRTLELEQLNLKIQETDHLKSLFLASMSHELRTPLNSIIGFSEILLLDYTDKLDETSKQYLEIIFDGSHYLLNLINGILDISKIESGKLEIFPTHFSFKKILKNVIDSLSPRLLEKELNFDFEIFSDTNLYSDEDRVKQILFNLIGNAIKFTPNRGKITIETKTHPEKLEIHIIDDGIGISKKNKKKLFRPFQQIDMTISKKYRGTGLGLYLTKSLVNLLGGEISVETEVGKGSDFKFTILTNINKIQ